jgi:uncharacterized membrane protein YfcA
MLEYNTPTIVLIASICGLLAGLLGSPGFALIIPLLFIFNITGDFKVALGVFFIGAILPFFIMSILYGLKHSEHINYELSLLFSIIFTITAYLSIYYIQIDSEYKLFISGIILCGIGVWFLHYYFTRKTI